MNNNKAKSLATVISFLATVVLLAVLLLVLPRGVYSQSERRKLKTFPVFSTSGLLDGSFFASTEEYFTDHFPFRDSFRAIKSVTSYDIMLKMNNNGYYIYDSSICKSEYPLSEKALNTFVNKLNSIYDTYLSGMNVYYAVIPDKEYFVPEKAGQLKPDYNALISKLGSGLKNMTYIDLFDTLTLDDYYTTDIHWRQECLQDTVNALAEGMKFDSPVLESLSSNALYPFYGAYYGHAAYPLKPDTMIYMTSPAINNSTVYNYETGKTVSIYELSDFDGKDPYDLFLGGAVTLISITNPDVAEKRELIIFRDSFGSSISPLLAEKYSKITLVDIRYIASSLLGKFIEFDDQDVLFLYSVPIINNSAMLK